MCRQITEAPSADVVTRAAAGGNIVRRLRESVARTQLPKPKEAPMKVTDLKAESSPLCTRPCVRASASSPRGATDEQVAEALKGINDGIGEVETLAGNRHRGRDQGRFREAERRGDSAKLAKEKGELEVKLREPRPSVTG